MSVWVIIPVKPLTRAKSRLSAVLSAEQRQQLAEMLLRHVIATVRQVPEIVGTLVISRDTKALAIARDAGTYTVQESGTPELNNALMRATSVVAGWGGSAVLVLPADLPLVSAEDVRNLVELGLEPNTIVLATDHQEDGTNAMLVRPPGLIPYAFGPGSFARHLKLAQEMRANVHVYSSERMMLDIDVPADLLVYERLVGRTLLTPNGA
ncbi:MAG: 2-phospho-L-lactate guanylyltransferase [Aggregatilineales bacterium]